MMDYYYPNRPMLVPPDPKTPLQPKPDYLNSLEQSGRWVAEQKWNGDNALIDTTTMVFWGRERNRLTYQPSTQVIDDLNRFPQGCLLNAEVVHRHTKTVKNLVIVHCIMVYDTKPLIGKTWGDSRKLLETFQYGEHVRLSPVWKTGFWDLWNQADGDIIEGIVLKDPSGLLQLSQVPLADVPWMLKVRKPCKKYSF